MIGWCEENLQHFRDQYYIIFNLTGAFKSLQGYMNIAGMFYADEIVYIFETGSSLLRIPRLPIRVDDKELRIWRTELALLSQGHVYEADQVEGLPDALLDKDKSSHVSLSDWGIVIWNRIREGLLSEELLPFPRLQYEGKFSRDFRQISNKEKFALQEVLAKVSSLLESHNGDTSALKSDGGLQYDNYTNQRTPDGSPIGHFRVSQGLRVSCVMNGGILTLRRYGREPDVNGNP